MPGKRSRPRFVSPTRQEWTIMRKGLVNAAHDGGALSAPAHNPPGRTTRAIYSSAPAIVPPFRGHMRQSRSRIRYDLGANMARVSPALPLPYPIDMAFVESSRWIQPDPTPAAGRFSRTNADIAGLLRGSCCSPCCVGDHASVALFALMKTRVCPTRPSGSPLRI